MTGNKLFLTFLVSVYVVFSGFTQEGGKNLPPHAIINASYAGDEKTVKAILAAGEVDIDVRDALGGTALHAATFQSNLIVIKLLLDYGFNPNIRAEKNGNTPLHYAVASSNAGAVRLLLQYGASKNIRNLEGLTPLEKSRREGKSEITRILSR